MSLARARQLAYENRAAATEGRDPRLKQPVALAMPTFGEAATKVHAMNRPRWSNEHHAKFWLRSLEMHAAPIWRMPLDAIGPADVIACLEHAWTTKPETMRRVRQRMQTVMRWGMAHQFIESNPAGEIISAALPTQPKVQQNLRAVHYLDLPDVLSTIRRSQASDAVKGCIEFIALTAARSGEARLAVWDEFDLSSAVWTVPAERMKRRVTHRVPLSARAVEVIEGALELRDGSNYVFPSPLRPGCPCPPRRCSSRCAAAASTRPSTGCAAPSRPGPSRCQTPPGP